MEQKYLLTILICIIASLPIAIAHDTSSSVMDPLVRVESFVEATEEFTFHCTPMEPYQGQLLAWTIRGDDNFVYYDTQTTNNLLTYTLDQDVMYHINCGSLAPDGDYIQGDFHVDRRTSEHTDKPNIQILDSEATQVTATCTHPTATDYNLYWYWNHESNNYQLTEFNNQEQITTNAPTIGVWELSCGVWDNGNQEWSQSALTLELFEQGPAYVPNAQGCVPGECSGDNQYNEWPSDRPLPTISIQATDVGSAAQVNVQLSEFVISEDTSGDGHLHLYVDGTKVTRFYDTTVNWNLPPGTHSLAVRLAGHDHTEFTRNGQPIQATAQVSIAGDTTGVAPAPTWIEPSQGKTDMDPFDFHIHTFPMAPEYEPHLLSDFEIWDEETNQRVWSALQTEVLEHIHREDGEFEADHITLDRLKYEHNYRLRARYYNDQGVSGWSEWRYFTTIPEQQLPQAGDAWNVQEGFEVEVVATGIDLPVDVIQAPDIYDSIPTADQPLLYFTQLYTDIGVLTRDGTYHTYADDLLNFNEIGGIPGAGEVGLTGLYADPTSGDLFATVIYDHPQGWGFYQRIEKFTTSNDGLTFTNRETILDGIPAAPAHHAHKITRGPDGKLYVNVGDDEQPVKAQDINTLNGKILRLNDDGSIPSDNPYGPNNYVYASGLRNPFGATWSDEGYLWITNNGADQDDGIYRVEAGENFGWCCDTASGTSWTWNPTIAPTSIDQIPNDGVLSSIAGQLVVAKSGKTYKQGPDFFGGKSIQRFTINGESLTDQGNLVEYAGSGYSAIIGLVATEQGLYFTDIYGEAGFDFTTLPPSTSGRILRIVPSGDATPGNDTGGNQTEDEPTQGYNRLDELPASCSRGSITTDTYNGCRTLVCTDGAESTQILACDKPDSQNPEYFEMYLQSGGAINVCLADVCVDGRGFVQSPPYPIATQEGDDEGDNTGDNQTPTEDPAVCASKLNEINVTCNGGTITQDNYNGCRSVTCEQGANTLTTLACDKPDAVNPEYFEVYQQERTGSGIEICYGDVCMDDEGFLQSRPYSELTCEEQPNDNPDDGGEGEDPQPQGNVTISMAQWYPQGTHVVLECSSEQASSYSWSFGDGDTQTTQQGSVYHIYPHNGTYTATCTVNNEADTLQVVIGEGEEQPPQEEEPPEEDPICYENLENMPATCNGGSITTDTYNGCRNITCEQEANTLSILACDKPTSFQPTHFEMYQQASSGSGIEICLADNCISNQGYVKSNDYPICEEQT